MSVTTPNELSFWTRQFSEPRTPGQIWFDVLVGCFLPLLCLFLDPIVFHSSEFGGPILFHFEVVASLVIAVGIISLGHWVGSGAYPALSSGLLSDGAAHALVLGVVMFPFSLIGLFFVIGLLGFSPFFTAFAFWRNAYRAFRASRSQRYLPRFASACVGLLISVGLPWGAQAYVNSRVAQAITLIQLKDPDDVAKGTAIFHRYKWAVHRLDLVKIYRNEPDDYHREQMALAYRELTGVGIEDEIARLEAD